jgi:hypothetical protein
MEEVEMSYRKVGVIRFVKVGRLCFSFCIARKASKSVVRTYLSGSGYRMNWTGTIVRDEVR